MATDVEIAWAAGVFEGEGTFTRTTRRNGGRIYHYPMAKVAMCDEDVVRRFHGVVGCGSVYCRAARRANWRPLIEWSVFGVERVLTLYTVFEPYLGARRREQAIAVLQAHGTRYGKPVDGIPAG